MAEQYIALDPAAIQAGILPELRSSLGSIHIHQKIPSTNEWLLEQGACADLCLAEAQSAGRGRRGRTWESPANANIYLSLRWCFASLPKHYGLLSLVTGLAVADALAEFGLQGHGIKWPNDIYVDGKKLGGILLQTAQPLQQVVIGIGLNVNMNEEIQSQIDQPWCSLAQCLGADQNRNWLVAGLLNHLLPALQTFPGLQQAKFNYQWKRWDLLAQKLVSVRTGNAVVQGRAEGLDEQGQLCVRLNNGEHKVFAAADVSIRL